MSAAISKIISSVGNGTNPANTVCDKDHDVEKGELHTDVRLSSSICSRPTSSSRTSTSAESRVELEDELSSRPNVASVEVEVEVASNNEPIGTSSIKETQHGWTNVVLSAGAGTEATTTTTAKTRTKTGTATETSGPSRWKAVGRLLRRLALIMLVLAGLVACLALLAISAGPIFLVQLLVVILVAYVVSGGRFRWFYVTFKTLPRDFTYLNSTNSLHDLNYQYRIGRSTLSSVIRITCTQIWEMLHEQCIPTPDKEKWKKIADGFETRANFPHCLGAIDGKHIRIVKPKGTASEYFNYKNYFSIILLAVVDSDYRFTYIDVGSFGKDSDSTIYRNSSLWIALQNNSLDIPPSSPIPGILIHLPYAFVGDEAFGLGQNMLRPYAGEYLPKEKRIFNYRLLRARRYVECTFGILSNKWRILHQPINVDIEFAIDIVKCCCVLHNFVRERDGYKFEDTLSVTGLDTVDATIDNSVHVNRTNNIYRDALTKYFISNAGQLPWQNDSV